MTNRSILVQTFTKEIYTKCNIVIYLSFIERTFLHEYGLLILQYNCGNLVKRSKDYKKATVSKTCHLMIIWIKQVKKMYIELISKENEENDRKIKSIYLESLRERAEKFNSNRQTNQCSHATVWNSWCEEDQYLVTMVTHL